MTSDVVLTSPNKRTKVCRQNDEETHPPNNSKTTDDQTSYCDSRVQGPLSNRRKLFSVFSSNQAIHKLTEKIVQSHGNSNRCEDKSHRPDDRESNNDNGNDNGDRRALEHAVRKNSEEEVLLTESNLINPFVDYPHLRHFCGVYKFEEDPGKFCEKCFCKVCNIPAQKCVVWSEHCYACDKPEWELKRRQALESKNIIVLDDDDDDCNDNGIVHYDHGRNLAEFHGNLCVSNEQSPTDKNEDERNNTSMMTDEDGIHGGHLEVPAAHEDGDFDDNDEFMDNYDHHFDQQRDKNLIGQKSRKDARITEVLSHNLRQLTKLSIANSSTESRNGNIDLSQIHKMQGDIPQLNLHSSFFVEGVRIGWPYPAIMPPQRQMALHLIKAFKNNRHVVIESPTGTGKSAAILCSALAWQRFHAKTNNGGTTKIIYCSRTHSQVTQMVASLKKTPYRPRMAILGSRDRLCIHKDIRPRNGVDSVHGKMKSRENVNTACQIRVGNTEAYRKYAMNKKDMEYNDDRPPIYHPGDGGGGGGGGAVEGNANDDSEEKNDEPEGGSRWIGSDKAKMCPHYRQLTSESLAKSAFQSLVPDRQRVNCCSRGGDKTRFGAHDIEDLVNFGVLPNVKRGIALYRETSTGASFGLKLKQVKGKRGPISVNSVSKIGAAASEGTIKEGDTIISINNLDISSGYDVNDISNRIRDASDPLLLDVYQGDGNKIDQNEYSEESACPYYLSRALAKDADIVFCPYNYVLDPNIRNAMEIDIKNSIVVLDEAHNVEDTLRQEGSGKFGEIELLEMNVLLSSYASRWIPRELLSPFGKEKESLHDKIPEITHDILVFLDKIIDIMRGSRHIFESDQGKNGVTSVTEEYQKFKCPDDKEFEILYFGPTGSGDGANPVGCREFFARHGITQKEIDLVRTQISCFQEYMFSKKSDERSETRNTLAERLFSVVTTLCTAFQLSEHYYISTVIMANGNLDFATGLGTRDGNAARFKRKPKAIPRNPPGTIHNPDPQPRICNHPSCNKKSLGTVSHDIHCNGTTPRWESHLVINLLTPAILMAPILEHSRSVVLASGSLAPLESLCSELHLLPPSVDEDSKEISQSSGEAVDEDEHVMSDPLASTSGRLQVAPRPLEANHVVDLNRQLLAISIGHFPDGSPLSVTYSNYNRTGFHHKLGHAISTVIESIPHGGVLVFVPSFSFLRKCVSTWQNSETWQRLLRSKGEIVVEPSSSQEEFEEARDNFNGTIEKTGNCILLAVFRGKMSEGVSFNDDYARGVICVGIPFPSSHDRAISAKMSYNNEQRKFRSKGLLSGTEWYNQQAYRAVAQAIGRCIRHAADYGTIILLDSRHCDDGHSYNRSGVCSAHSNLPKWMRNSVRTLRRDMRQIGRNDLLGGWDNLRKEMTIFFQSARVHCASVIEKQKNDFQKKQESSSQLSQDLLFDHLSGQWSSSQATPET